MTDAAADASLSDDESAIESAPGVETTLVSIPTLEGLNEAFAEILRDPVGSRVARTDAEASVLANVRAAFINQNQFPISHRSHRQRVVRSLP